MKREVHSDILDKTFKIDVTTKAHRTMMKRGSFDNYLMLTHPRMIDSKWGMYIRAMIKKKQANPEFELPYVRGNTRHHKYRKRSIDIDNPVMPHIFMSADTIMNEDMSKYYIKPYNELSRYEIEDFKTFVAINEEPDIEEDETVRQSQEFLDLQDRVRKL